MRQNIKTLKRYLHYPIFTVTLRLADLFVEEQDGY